VLHRNSSHWAEVPIGEILTYLDEKVVFDDMAEYITITVKRRHGGLEAREKLFGHEIKTKKQYRLRRGAFIISRVQCWHAAFALVPDDIPENMIASQNYDQFEISPKVDHRFFWWLSHSPQFIETVRSSASGVVIEKLVFNRDAWLQKTIPLPPLDEQRHIVERIEALTSRISKAQSLRDEAQRELEIFEASLLNKTLGEIGKDLPQGWEWKSASEFCVAVDCGSTPEADLLSSGSGEVPFIKVYNLTFDGTLDFSVKPTFVSAETHNTRLKRSRVFPGDVLTNIVGPPLGKVSIVPDTYPEWNINQAIVSFRVNREVVDNKYLAYILQSPDFQARTRATTKGSAGQDNISLSTCRSIPMPIPPLDEQRPIVAYLDSVQARLASLRELQSATGEELSALLPSVLDRAFKGEL
jgi:type I restriction enzyme, S subunit